MPSRARSRSRSAGRASGLGPTLIACLVVLLGSALLLGRQTFPAQRSNAELKREMADLEAKIAAEEEIAERLAEQRAAFESGDFEYMREAYRRFRLVPDEELVVVR
jgi:hypothetical protein